MEYFEMLEADVIRRKELIDSPDSDPEDKLFIERMAVASIENSVDVGKISHGQREELMRILGV